MPLAWPSWTPVLTALTHWYWHSSAGSSLSDSLLVRSKRLGHVYNFRDNFDCFRDSRTKGQFPGESRKFRDGWQVCICILIMQMITYTLQEGKLLEEESDVDLDGAELIQHINEVGKPLILPVLILLPTLGQLLQLLLVCHFVCLLYQELQELWCGWVGDIKVLGESLTDSHRYREPPFLIQVSQALLALKIDGFIRVIWYCEVLQELIDQLGVVLRVDSDMVPRNMVQLHVICVKYHQDCGTTNSGREEGGEVSRERGDKVVEVSILNMQLIVCIA